MKKNLKRNFKRWIAFLLAVVLIVTTCVYSSDAHLRAEGEDTEVESQSEPASEEVEMTPTEVGDSNEDPQPEVEETYDEELVEVVETPSEEPAQGSEETTTTPEELPENPETTPAESADPSVSPSADPTIDPSASPSASPSATPSASPEKEAEETYSYTICYYYDGVEDEDARVEKEDGVLGEKILVSVVVDEEVTIDKKIYKLEKIENKDGEITEEAKDNVVGVYYVLVEKYGKTPEADASYTLKLESVPSEGGKVEVVSVEGEKADGKNEYKKDTKVTFEVYVNKGYKLSAAADQNGVELKAESQNEKDGVYTYVVTMNEDKAITVTYEKAEGEKEAKEEMPAQKLEASAGSVVVTIDVPEGVLPKGTVAEVAAVDGYDISEAIILALSEKKLFPTEISAVDITLTKDGEKVSPKGKLTVKLDNVFTDVPGLEAAVYHVNGSTAEYVCSADPSASSVEFETDHFSVYAAVKAVSSDEYGADTLAEMGDKGVKRGIKIINAKSNKEICLEGTWGNDNGEHKWEVVQDDTDVRIDRRDDNYAWVKAGDKTGTASVVHTYGTEKEYWDISVIQAVDGGVERVYIFVQVKTEGVDTTGWTLNSHGYYTVGYVDVPGEVILKGNKFVADYLKGKIKDGDIYTVNNTINLDLSDVTWDAEVRQGVYGADEFVDVSKDSTYHLDGVIEMISGSYKVKYYCDGELDESKSHEVTEAIKKDAEVIPINSNKIIANPFGDEYEFVYYKIDGTELKELPETVKKDGTIEVYYRNINKTYKLYYSGGNGVSGDRVLKGEYKAGDEVKVIAPSGLLKNSNENAVFAELWKSSVDGNFVKEGDEFIMPDQDVTLTAQWKVLTVDKTVDGIYSKEGQKKDKADKGDTVKFKITVKNAGDVDLSSVSVTDNGISTGSYTNPNVTIDKEIIDKLPAGETQTIEASYTVTDQEVGKSDVVNTVTVEAEGVKVEDKTDIQMEEADKQLSVEKKIVKPESATGEEGKYRTGDTVWFEVTVINTGNVDLKDIYVEEDAAFEDAVIHDGSGYDVKDHKAVIGDLKPGDNNKVVISVSYKIKETDLGKTDFRNKVTVTTADIDGKKEVASEPIPVEGKKVDIKLEKYLTKILDKNNSEVNTNEVKEGNVIYYRIDIENVGNVDLNYLEVNDILSKTLGNNVELGQVSLKKVSGTAEVNIKGNEAVITKLPYSGESGERNITLECSYTVARDDAGKTIDNKVTVSPQESPDLKWSDDADSVKVNGLGYTINYYYDGQLAEAEIINVSDATYDAPIEYITEGTAFEKEYNSEKYMFSKALIGEKVIAEIVGKGEEARLAAEVIKATSDNQVINVYYVKDSNGPEGVPDKIPDSEEHKVIYHGGRNAIETDVITDGYLYPEGYSVKVSQNTFTNSNENADFAYWKTDIANIEIIRSNEQFDMPGHDVNLTAQWKTIRVSKAVDRITSEKNEEKKVAGINDRVDFIITVENDGDMPLKQVIVSDDGLSVEGSPVPSNVIIDENSGYEVIGNQAVIASLAESGKVEIKAHYIVTENEVGQTNVTNKATAKGDGIEETGETDPIPMEDVNRWLTIEKEIVDRDKTATGGFENGVDGLRLYTTGDTVRFEVTVTNTGNQTLKDITVEDLLDGAVIESGSWISQLVNGYTVTNGIPIITELKPLESATFKASYIVKETDLGRHFYNTVSAKADGEEWKGNSKEIPVEDKKPSAKVEKRLNRIVDPEGNEVMGRNPKEGDVIYYQIEVENVGNMDLENIRVEDILHVSPEDETEDRQVTFEEMEGVTIEGNVAIITKLDRADTNNNRKITLNCSYQVRRADAGKVIMNGVNVSSDTKKPDGSDLDVEKPEREVEVTVQRLYTLTVEYVYEAGGTAAASYIGQYYEGDIYRVDSPVIAGYNRVDFVAGVMPNNDLPLRVVYATTATPPTTGGGDPDPNPIDPDTSPIPTVSPVTPVDEEPDPVVPGDPAVPGAPGVVVVTAPEAPALVAVGDEPVPLQGALVETDDDGNVTVIPITEDEIPLANREIDDHKCCIMSFLLMLATLIIYSWFTHSMKKRQKKLAELKDQLAEETLKRQLGIADESSRR